jgi:nucleoside-diphosphate-sugar epimerase
VSKRVPLPFGRIHNRRSVLYVGNLVDALNHMLGRHATLHQTVLIADGRALSSRELICMMAKALRVQPRLLPIPLWCLRAGATLAGKPMLYHKLCSNLEMDTAPTNALLEWTAPYTTQEGLIHTAMWFREATR